MAKTQRGWLRPKNYSAGTMWVFYFHVIRARDGKRVENSRVVGLVKDIGSSRAAAWEEVERLGLAKDINSAAVASRTFSELADDYKKHGLERKRLSKKKDEGSIYTLTHNLDDYVFPRWGQSVATDIDPVAVEDWLLTLHDDGLAWGTVVKIRQAMSAVFKNARKRKLVDPDLDPLKDIECEAESDYEAITCEPHETLAIVSQLDGMVKVLAVLVAATAVRISEALALRWGDIGYDKHHIWIRSRFRLGRLADPKSRASKAPVPMCSVLTEFLKLWHAETPYSRPQDFVFFSAKLKGKKPRTGNMISQDYVKPAAVSAGVLTVNRNGTYFDRLGRPVKRFGFHNLRHSLSTWLVEQGEDPKVVQGILRHANIRTTLDGYTHVVPRKALAAQTKYMETLLNGRNALDLMQLPPTSSEANKPNPA